MGNAKVRVGQYVQAVDSLLVEVHERLDAAKLGLSAAFEIDENERLSQAEHELAEISEKLEAIQIRLRRVK